MKSIFFCTLVIIFFISCNGAGTDQASPADTSGKTISIDTVKKDSTGAVPYSPDSAAIHRDTTMRQ